jgi:hypothetical protein
MDISLFLERKEKYTNHLVDTITPFIYEGLKAIYEDAVKLGQKDKDKIIIIFQKILLNIPKWNSELVQNETMRIKTKSCAIEYFDDLFRAVIKSHIVLLASSDKINQKITPTFYENLSVESFIHRCYIESSKESFNHAYLYYHEVSAVEYKRNQSSIIVSIRSCIYKAIDRTLPFKTILQEYLSAPITYPNQQQIVQPIVESIPPVIQPVLPVPLVTQPIIPPMAIPVPPHVMQPIEPFRQLPQKLSYQESETMRQLIQMDNVLSHKEPKQMLVPQTKSQIQQFQPTPMVTPQIRTIPSVLAVSTIPQAPRKVMQISIPHENIFYDTPKQSPVKTSTSNNDKMYSHVPSVSNFAPIITRLNTGKNDSMTFSISKFNPMLLDQGTESGTYDDTAKKLVNLNFDEESTRSMTDIIKRSVVESIQPSKSIQPKSKVQNVQNDYIEVYNNRGSETRTKVKDPNKIYFKSQAGSTGSAK